MFDANYVHVRRRHVGFAQGCSWLFVLTAIVAGCSKAGLSHDADQVATERKWHEQVEGTQEFKNLQNIIVTLFEAGPSPPGPEEFNDAVDAFLTDFPSEHSVAFLASQAVDIEYTGYPDYAASLIERLRPRLGQMEDSQVKAQIAAQFDLFDKRMSMIGKPVDMSGLATIERGEFDWTAYRGKVVLVDFWTTACQPCIAEMPNMKVVYDKYHDRGFEIVSVNMDENADAVGPFIEQRKLPWTVVRSSDAAHPAYDSPAAQRLAVTRIPFMFLVDRAGIMAALHTREKMLEQTVAELIGQNQKQAEPQR